MTESVMTVGIELLSQIKSIPREAMKIKKGQHWGKVQCNVFWDTLQNLLDFIPRSVWDNISKIGSRCHLEPGIWVPVGTGNPNSEYQVAPGTQTIILGFPVAPSTQFLGSRCHQEPKVLATQHPVPPGTQNSRYPVPLGTQYYRYMVLPGT